MAGAVQVVEVPQRVVASADPMPGDQRTIALPAINGTLAALVGAVFVRYATLAFEWRYPRY